MGLYIVDEATLEGSPQTMKIKGHAADLKASLKSQKLMNGIKKPSVIWSIPLPPNMAMNNALPHNLQIFYCRTLIKPLKAICIYSLALRSSMEQSVNPPVGSYFLFPKAKPNPLLVKLLVGGVPLI